MVCNSLVWGAFSNWQKKSSHSGLICSTISTEYNKVTFFPLLKAYAIFLHLFLLAFPSLSLLLQLVSPSFPKISFLNPNIIKKKFIQSVNTSIIPHDPNPIEICSYSRDVLPGFPNGQLIRSLALAIVMIRFLLMTTSQFFYPLEMYLTNHCSGPVIQHTTKHTARRVKGADARKTQC